MQKVGSGQQDAQGEWRFFWPRTSRKSSRTRWPASCHSGRDLKNSSSNHFSKKTNTFSTLSKCLPVAAHLAPAPAAAINAPARAAAYVFQVPPLLPLNCRANARNPPPSARHWEATTGRTSTGPSRSDEGPCSPTVNSSQVFVICHISGLGGREWLFLCCWNLLECKELGL
ncbi:hypothetical protein E4U14_001112 [Claviceps sp. LM454 group G7]|nr:hypothetical protein E4U14_001112 [Claviceps sp. LM454 group G7]